MSKKIKAETLLKKIQTGVMNTVKETGRKIPGFNFDDSGRIKMFKRREIVQPYLHPMDSRIVNEQIEKTVKSACQNLDQNIAANYSKLLPSHLVNDLYSLYFNPSNKMKFEGLNGTNKVKFDILDSINNSLIKIVTNNSHIGSYVYTEEISKFLYKKFMELTPEQREELKKALENCNQGEGDGDQEEESGGNSKKGTSGNGKSSGKNKESHENDIDGQGRVDSNPNEEIKDNRNSSARGQANNSHGKNSKKDMSQDAADKIDKGLKDALESLKNNIDSKQSQKELEKAFSNAQEKLDKLKDIGVETENDEEVPETERREIMNNLNNLDSIRRSLQSLNVSKDKILKAVQKILNNTTNYFSQKCITKDVELFEADELLDISGIELLHPAFRKSRILDLSVIERKYIGKFDLYVDCSGSMSSGCGGDLERVQRIELAKSLAIQMKELGILGDLYEFEDTPTKISNTDISILMMSARGGTNIETVLQNILKTGNNSVILTDGESSISTHTHKALFIGVGTDFHYFKHYGDGPGRKFVEEGQCVHYDGKNFVDSGTTK
jgi:hypothetical protein